MRNRMYALIAIILTLLIINICLSLYIDNDEYYEDNYLSHYYKLKNMPTIIPFDFDEPDYDYQFYIDFINENMGKRGFFHHNYLYNSNQFDYCYSLLNNFIFCLSSDYERNRRCKKLLDKKIHELEKCEMINFNNYKQKMKNNISHFNMPNSDMNSDIEDEAYIQKINYMNYFSLENNNKNVKKYEKQNLNQLALVDENQEKKENINDYSNMDCVEYGLIDEHIICTKYE